MPSKSNGKEPVENGGIRNSKDVDMKDDGSSLKGKGKGKKALNKDGADEEMTVVVPPPKSAKQNAAGSAPPNDAEGDVVMDDTDKAEDGEVKVDPVVQTVSGACVSWLCRPGIRQWAPCPVRG